MPCLALLAACAAPGLPPVRAGQRHEHRGYSFRAPPGAWHEVPTGTRLATTLSRSAFPGYAWRDRFRARSLVFEAADGPGSEGVWSSYRARTRELQEQGRYTLVDERWRPSPGPGRDCIRFETRFVFSLRSPVQHTRGLACRHPAHPDAAVALLWTEVVPSGSKGQEQPEWEPFLSSLELTADRPVPLETSWVSLHGMIRPAVVALGQDALWMAASHRTVAALDPRSLADRSPRHVELPGSAASPELLEGIAAVEEGGSLWVAYRASIHPDALHRVELSSGSPAAPIAAPVPTWISGGEGNVFLTGREGLHRIRVADGELVRIRPGPHASPAVAGGALWVADERSQQLVAVDVRTGAQRGQPIGAPARPAALVPVRDALVVVSEQPRPALFRVELPGGRVAGSAELASAPRGACLRRGLLWVSLPDEGVLRAFDPASLRIVDALPLRAESGLVCDERALWTTVRVGSLVEVARLAP